MVAISLLKRGIVSAGIVLCLALPSMGDDDLAALLDDDFEERSGAAIYDPLEPVNRAFFVFNDRLYFWLLKPVGKVYSAVLADEAVRGSISAAFHNVLAPVRVVNNLLQGKFRQSGTEVARFTINTLLGAGGLGDPAAEEFGLSRADEDLGQTLAFYGIGEGIYICWPLLGPSSLRDTVGMAGDYFLNPLSHVLAGEPRTSAALAALKAENAATLHGQEYENLVGDAFDPYVAMRDIYYQHRRSLIASEGTRSQGRDRVLGAAFSLEQCPGEHGEGSFRNLARARKYQQCLTSAGMEVSLRRLLRQGRPLYLVAPDGEDVSQPRMARVAWNAGGYKIE